MSLRETQELFWRAITWPTGVADFLAQADAETRARFEATFDETPSFSRRERVDVYADAYFWRLAGVLEEQFPVVTWLTTGDRFRNLVTDYVLACPSVDPDIRQFGRRFPEFIEAHSIVGALPHLAEIARIDWAIVEVLDLPDGDRLTLDDLRSVPADRWPDLRFVVAETTRVLDAQWSFPELWRAMKAGEAATKPRSSRVDVVVWRSAHDVYHRAVPAEEAAALRALMERRRFAEVCSVVSTAEPSVDPSRVAGWVARWVESGLIESIQ